MQNQSKHDEEEEIKWDGVRGISFEAFRRQVRVHFTGFYCSPQDDYNLWEACTGECMGGDSPLAPPLPVGAGLAAAQRFRNKRQNKCWALLCKMLTEDKTLLNLLLNLVPGDIPVGGGGVGFREHSSKHQKFNKR